MWRSCANASYWAESQAEYHLSAALLLWFCDALLITERIRLGRLLQEQPLAAWRLRAGRRAVSARLLLAWHFGAPGGQRVKVPNQMASRSRGAVILTYLGSLLNPPCVSGTPVVLIVPSGATGSPAFCLGCASGFGVCWFSGWPWAGCSFRLNNHTWRVIDLVVANHDAQRRMGPRVAYRSARYNHKCLVRDRAPW